MNPDDNENSLARLMAEAQFIIEEWENAFTMPDDIDVICSAFDAIDASLTNLPYPTLAYMSGMRWVAHSIARSMADNLWYSRIWGIQ